MANPVVTLDASPFVGSGYVRLTWTNANKGSSWYSWRVYRRPVGTTTWTLLKEYLYDASNYTFDDYWMPQQVAMEWVVVRVFLSSGVPTEEAHTPTYASTLLGDNYWLVHPTDITKVFLLYQVTDDSVQQEQDIAVLNLIGRGRKVEYGTLWGNKGSISCELRDITALTARQQLTNLRSILAAGSWVWLRNPFGDMWRVAISGLQSKRVPGVGNREYTETSFDYTEIVV